MKWQDWLEKWGMTSLSISAGFAVSWFTNLPTGATIVTVLVLFWLVARAARSLKRSGRIERMKTEKI